MSTVPSRRIVSAVQSQVGQRAQRIDVEVGVDQRRRLADHRDAGSPSVSVQVTVWT
jgi:hypothetical protein